MVVLCAALAASCGDAGSNASADETATPGEDSQSDSGSDPPGSCGWQGGGYACGFEGSDPGGTPATCPADVTPGTACEAQGSPSCCDADGNAVVCTCDGQACSYLWRVYDCSHAAGAGACGWWSEWSTYSCGGDGADPGGAPMSCADGIVAGGECSAAQIASCCDASGDQWNCNELDNGGPSIWGTIDC